MDSNGVATADELLRRVRDSRQKAEQERMQAEQEREMQVLASRAARLDQARAEIESRLIRADIEASMARRTADLQVVQAAPTYGPTGQRLDEQQRCMLQARQLEAGVRVQDSADSEMAERPRRRTRWQSGDKNEETRQRSSSRSPRAGAASARKSGS